MSGYEAKTRLTYLLWRKCKVKRDNETIDTVVAGTFVLLPKTFDFCYLSRETSTCREKLLILSQDS